MELRRWTAGVGGAAILVAMLMPLSAATTRAQDPSQQSPGGGRGQFAGMQRVTGVITAIAGSQVTIKNLDGVVFQVVTTDNTRIMQGRGVPAKLTDLKPGDGLVAAGNLDEPNKTLHAGIVMAIDAGVVKRMEEQHKQEIAALGKTLIAGRVTAIDLDNATMAVERPDGVSQTIGFDEGTSFRRGRATLSVMRPGVGAATDAARPANPAAAPPAGESITLADIRVGDRIAGPGELKNGRFIARQLNVMTPGAERRRSGENAAGTPASGTGAGAPQPDSSSPK